jgi:hypothetical protein
VLVRSPVKCGYVTLIRYISEQAATSSQHLDSRYAFLAKSSDNTAATLTIVSRELSKHKELRWNCVASFRVIPGHWEIDASERAAMWWTKAEMHAMARAEIERRRSAMKEDDNRNASRTARKIEAARLFVHGQAQ